MKKNKSNKTNTLLLTVIGVATLLIATAGASFAYFTANITGAESGTTVTVGSGTLTIKYAGGAGIETAPLIPISNGDPVGIKTFTVTGTNSTATTMPYAISLVVTKNTFTSNTLKFTLTSTNTAPVNGTIAPSIAAETGIATGASTIPLGAGNFSGVVTNNVHTYVLKIFFPDSGSNQDVDKNKELLAYVNTVVTAIS